MVYQLIHDHWEPVGEFGNRASVSRVIGVFENLADAEEVIRRFVETGKRRDSFCVREMRVIPHTGFNADQIVGNIRIPADADE